MSDLKRKWNPCKICKKYYDYSCCESIKNCKNFIPDNFFRNFLSLNGYEIGPLFGQPLDTIYFIDDEVKIPEGIKDFANLRNKDLNTIRETLHYKVDFIHIFFLSINDEIRDFIYNDDYIMSHYKINMVIDSNIKKSLKYRLDERFSYIEYTELED